MLCSVGKIVYCIFAVFALLGRTGWAQQTLGNPASEKVPNLAEIVRNLLNNIERSGRWNENLHIGLIFSEFLIKQKVRFYESTRFESQLYDEILQRINRIREKIIKKNGLGRLNSILQRNVLLVKPIVRQNQIDTNLEYKSLVLRYDALAENGFPNASLSDFCLLHISNLEDCEDLRTECLKVISSGMPTYGYRRMHQILLLYVLMHHSCSVQYGSELAYQILASQHCSQAYREHRVISGSLSKRNRDLYIEQSSICGLFGFSEFLNITEIRKIAQWERYGACDCVGRLYVYEHSFDKTTCMCTDHTHSVSLVLYINAMLSLR